MATEQTISPTEGNAPFPYERVPDANWPGFEAIDFRRAWSRAYVEGVVSSAAWKVSEADALGLHVKIAADVDPAFVQGDSTADQGLYYVPPHGGGITLDITPPDASNSRIDRVVLHVEDDTHDGSGQKRARVRVLAGTPTNGATLDNRAGALEVPDTALWLADVLVEKNATQITNQQIRDYRTYGLRDARVGEIRMFAAGSIPDGFTDADAGELRRAQHFRLFAELGTAHGSGDGSLTFNKPDFVDRVPLGRSGTRPVGSKGGAETHTLTIAEIPPHDHVLQFGGSDKMQAGTSGPIGIAYNSTTANITKKTGGGAAHSIMQPYTAMVFAVFTGSVAT